MLQKKICMVGVFGTGKTCLVQRYVHSIFSVKYLSTVGVKIDRKQVTVGSEPLTLMLWDLEGRDQHHDISPSYLRGAHGLIYVVNGTRRETFTQLWHLVQGSRPSITGRTIRTRQERGNLVIRQLTPVDSTRIVTGQERPLQGWVSLRYRQFKAAPVVESRISGGSARFVTLLVPVMFPKVRVRVWDVHVSADGVTFRVTVGRETEKVTMTRGSVRIESSR